VASERSLAVPSSVDASTSFEIGLYREGDEFSICALFEKVFHERKSLAQWRWQFVESSPAAPHVVVARDRAGIVIGHFGSLPRRACVGKRRFLFAQSVDSMVDPDRARGLKNPGLFTALVRCWIKRFGNEAEPIAYGLPNRAAYRIGGRFLGYTRLFDPVVFVKDVDGDARAPLADTESGEHPEPDHDDLWERAAHRLDVAVMRDQAYFDWRYVRCPSARYRFVAARRGATLAAVAVFRDAYLAPDCGAIVDLLWDGEQRDSLSEVVTRCEELARAARLHHVVTMLPLHAPELAILGQLGFRPTQCGHFVVARSFSPALPLERVRDLWWFTFGDSDLV